MIKLSPPTHIADDVYTMCVNSMRNGSRKQRLMGAKADVMQAAADYALRAPGETLHELQRWEGEDSEVVTGTVTKGELKKLYTGQLTPQSKPARVVYEQLRSRAPHQICPLCGFGEVRTLDHYLPKARYPLFSVCPDNLVPACRDCNTEKLEAFYTSAAELPLHPYFDADRFYTEQWLVAEVEHTFPVVVKFRTAPPAAWPAVARERVGSHLRCYKLQRRLSVQAASELSTLGPELALMDDVSMRHEHLATRARVAYTVQRNSWKTAMLQALRDDQWYLSTGCL